jgi:membrane-bound lytic murein transglycosylase D
MKRIVKIAMTGLLLTIFTSCNSWLFNKKPKTAPAAELQTISQLLQKAQSSIDSVDTEQIEKYYFTAIHKSDSLLMIYPTDSVLASLNKQAIDAYEFYDHQTAALIADTLTQDEVLSEIENMMAISDSAGFSVDSLEELRIPLILNNKIERAIRYFTENRRGRKIFSTWLRRAGKYESLVKGILREEGAPEELFYLAMIESGLRPTARSYARADGMWQFMAATGRHYGLRNSWWFDERRDVIKATRAAGRHLLDLYEQFGDWYIAIAGYNFSPGKIERRIKKYQVDEFWDLPKLPKQTRNYVPTYLAAVTIASDPEKYGFTDIIPEAPFAFDTVTVDQSIDLNVIADAVGCTYKELRELNPAILRWCTPPDVDKWLLYLPKGTREVFLSKYESLPKSEKRDWVQHRVRSGEALSTIARRYGVSVTEIKRFNKLRSNLIRIGQRLMIPVPAGSAKAKYASSSPQRTYQPAQKQATPPVQVVEDVPGRKKQIYTVQSGDNLWTISRKFNVALSDLQKWNGLTRRSTIRPGQQLNIWLIEEDANAALANVLLPLPGSASADSTPKGNVYIVRSGDTLWDIAKAFNVSISDLKRWNGIRGNRIKPGDELIIAAE